MRKQLFRSGMIVSAMTMLSRVLGLLRDVVLAALFGAGGGADAFFVAFKIPNFLRRLFGEGAFAQAFVPVLAQTMARDSGQLETRRLIAAVSGLLFLALGALTLLVVWFADYVVWVFAPGFADDVVKMALAGDLLQLTFPYLFFIAGVAFAGSILNAHDRFAVPAFTPVLLNLSLIGSALLWADDFQPSVMALGWGVLIAGTVQFLFQLPFLGRLGLLPRPRWEPRNSGVRQIGRLMLPALFGVGVSQINLLLDTVLASFLVDGSVSWLYFSDRLVELPLGVVGIAIATVILPKLSHAANADVANADVANADVANANSSQRGNEIQDWALGLCLILGMPACAALIILAEPLLTTLFLYGQMQPSDIAQAAGSLRAYALGLLPFMFIKTLAPGFFSRQDTKTPVRIAIIAMVANMVFNLALIFPLAHVGLALATSASASVNAYLLYRGLRKNDWYQPGDQWAGLIIKVFSATGLMALVLIALLMVLPSGLDASLWLRVGMTSVYVIAGVAIYWLALRIFGLNPRQWLGK